jgi:plasmid maintenance system killer protein
MIKTFSHKCLNNFFNNGDTTKIQSDHIKKLRLLLANLTPTVFKDSILVTGLMKVYQYGFDN